MSAKQAAAILYGDAARPPGGQVVWSVPFEKSDGPSSYRPIRLSDGTIVVNGQKGTYAFHEDGTPAWHLDTGDCGYREPVAGPDGMLFIQRHDGDGQLYAVRADGKGATVVWARPIGKRGSSAAPVVGPDGRLYVADNDRRLRVLDPASGREIGNVAWEHLMSEEPTLLPDGHMILHGYDGYTATLDPHGRRSRLQRLLGEPAAQLESVFHADILKPTGVGPDGSVYEVCDGKTLRVLEPDSKTLRWQRELNRADTSIHVTLRKDGAVYVMSGDRHLSVFARDGKPLWSWEADGGLSWDYVQDENGTFYFTGEGANWKAYAVGPDGKKQWESDIGCHGGDAALGPNGTLLVGGDLQPLRALDRATGSVLYREPLILAFGSHPLVALQDGTVFAATDNGNLVRMQLQTRQTRERAVADEARQAAAKPDAPAPEIRRSEGYVVIGGVKVPVRS